jgi:hypothetical protein
MDYEKEIQDLSKRITSLEKCCETLKASLEKKEDKKEPPLPPVWPPPPPTPRGVRVIIEDQKRQ